jgi:hypothetical protein
MWPEVITRRPRDGHEGRRSMIQAFTRRLRQLFGRPELPLGDVAGEAWNDVGALPPASLMPVEEPGLIPLDLPAPPPVPMDARPPRTQDELEWEATLARMLARPDAVAIAASAATTVDSDPTPTAPIVTQPVVVVPPEETRPVVAEQVVAAQPIVPVLTSSDPTPAAELAERDQDDDWDAVIARARSRVEEPPAPEIQIDRRPAVPAPVPEPVEDEGDGDWETLILAAKARAATTPARRAATLVRTPPPVRLSAVIRDPGSEDRAWEEMIARAKRRAESAPPRSAAPRRRPPITGETGDWSAVIAAAKLRHQLHDRA